MITKLIGRTGEVADRDFVVPDDFTVLRIGAAPANEICVRADGVSREHARLLKKPDGCWVEDAGSRNGTFVNGQRLKAEKLQHLDVITLARRVDLIFVQLDHDEPQPVKAPPRVVLEHLEGPLAGTSMELPHGELTVGRSAGCQILILHPAVGKAHARIVHSDAQITIEDLKSANGTFVNDKRVTMTVLAHHDRISIGGVAQMRLRMGDRSDQDVGDPIAARRSEYDQEWRTRLVWSPTERIEVERGQANVIQMMEERKTAPPIEDAIRKASPEPAAPKRIQAIELTGGPEGSIVLGPGVHTIGRRGAADVRLAEGDRGASRIHASLTVSPDEVIVEDRSVNGTFVNDEKVSAPRHLADGDRIRCASTTFVVKVKR